MPEQFLIFQKIYDLVVSLYPIINHIPKSHRMVLGKFLEENCLTLLNQVTKANKTNGSVRESLQKEVSDSLDNLRILIRLTKDLRFLSIKQYTDVCEKLNEIGKMVYCWSKV